MSNFEKTQLAWANRFCLILLAGHVPASVVVALLCDSSALVALIGGLLLLAGPATLYLLQRESRLTSIALACTTMGFSALLIHLGHGKIEMHFHIFSALAFLIVFADMWPILAAGLTIALHHIAFWLWMPSSVFNYRATFGVVLVHAFFVVFEVVPACWIAVRLRRMIKVQGIVSEQLAGISERVSMAAANVQAGTTSLSQLTTDQAAMLEETSAAGAEISTVVRRSSDDTATAAILISEVNQSIELSNQKLTALTNSMGDISKSAEKISEVTRLVDQIAFQTNILALNAAVEAARAGEAGLGFGVVAEEVRLLAQRCAQAASDTASLIEQSANYSQTGNTRLAETTRTLSVIDSSAQKVKQLVDQLSQGAREQSTGVSEIASALTRLEQITQHTASHASENSVAAEALGQDAKLLVELVHQIEAIGTAAR